MAPAELFFPDLEIAFKLRMMPCPDQDAILYCAFGSKKYKSPRQRHSGGLMLSCRAEQAESDKESPGIARRAADSKIKIPTTRGFRAAMAQIEAHECGVGISAVFRSSPVGRDVLRRQEP